MKKACFLCLMVLLTFFGLSFSAMAGETPRPGLLRIYDSCLAIDDISARTACLEPYFIGITNDLSAAEAVHRAKTMKDEHIIDDCHMIAHMVGKANLYKHNYDLGRALASCSLECIQGCIHGGVQNYVAEKIDIRDLKKELGRICDSVNKDPLLRRQCVHGVGHGFLTRGYLPIAEALDACHQFKEREVDVCLGGLFMENMQKYLLDDEETLEKNLPNVCAEIKKMNNTSYNSYCFDAIGEGLMFYTAHDLPRSISLCAYSDDSEKHRDLCMRGAIIEASNAPALFNPEDCDSVPPHMQALCKDMQGHAAYKHGHGK